MCAGYTAVYTCVQSVSAEIGVCQAKVLKGLRSELRHVIPPRVSEQKRKRIWASMPKGSNVVPVWVVYEIGQYLDRLGADVQRFWFAASCVAGA